MLGGRIPDPTMEQRRASLIPPEEEHLQLESVIGSIEEEERRIEEQKVELASRKVRLATRVKSIRKANDAVVSRCPHLAEPFDPGCSRMEYS